MWKIELSDFKTCEKLTHICQDLQHLINVDIGYERYLVDGCSLLGVMSLMFHTVDIYLSKKVDKEIIDGFTNKIKNIGAYYED